MLSEAVPTLLVALLITTNPIRSYNRFAGFVERTLSTTDG